MRRTLSGLALLLALTLLPIIPGARAEKVAGVIRVLLTRPALTDRIDVALDGSYTLNGISFQRGSHLTITSKGKTLMVYYEGMALDAGKSLTLLRHQGEGSLENGLRINGGYELHPGDLKLTWQDGRIRAVLYAPVEEYLLGVVPYEMSDSFPLEALKAQAITARTYALRKAGASGQDYDVVDNTNDQAYYGIKAENQNAAQAVAQTAGLCGFYKGKLAECFYSASNGGQTELVSHVWGSGDYGYLMMLDDPYDVENPQSVVKAASLPKKMKGNDGLGKLKAPVLGALSEAMEALGFDGDGEHIRVTGIESAALAMPLYTDSPSRIMTLLKLSLNVEGRRLLEAEEDISIFALPPTPAPQSNQERWTDMYPLPQPVHIALDIFPTVEDSLELSINSGKNELVTLRETDEAFILESRRYGHGVGMSQRGAEWMAKTYAWTYSQILRFYYPGMDLKALSYDYALPPGLHHDFLATPGPAATPTPRPTLMPVSVTPAPGQYAVKVTNIGVSSYLNLRSETNTQSTVLRQLYYGQQLIVLKELGQWLEVKTDDATGYVMAEFVERVTPKP